MVPSESTVADATLLQQSAEQIPGLMVSKNVNVEEKREDVPWLVQGSVLILVAGFRLLGMS